MSNLPDWLTNTPGVTFAPRPPVKSLDMSAPKTLYCETCGESKPASEFYEHRRRICKKCYLGKRGGTKCSE